MLKFKRSKSIALEGILSKAWHGTTPIGFNGSHEANMPCDLFKNGRISIQLELPHGVSIDRALCIELELIRGT